MKSVKIICAAAILVVTLGAPAYAQMQNDSMKSDSMSKGGMMSSGSDMKMTMSQKRMMTRCKGMSHDMMMKNKGCMHMMKMHPEMMQDG